MKILLLHQYLVCGGRERVLMDYLAIFKSLDYQVDLLIEYDMGEENFFNIKDINFSEGGGYCVCLYY